MLRPSYSELMDAINQNDLVDSKITSRYTIVIATAKRARQLIENDQTASKDSAENAVMIAVKEINKQKISIIQKSTNYSNEEIYADAD